MGESSLAVKFQQSLIHVLRTDHLQVKESKRSDGRNMAILEPPQLPVAGVQAHGRNRKTKAHHKEGESDTDDNESESEATAFQSAIAMALDRVQEEEQEKEREERKLLRRNSRRSIDPKKLLRDSDKSGQFSFQAKARAKARAKTKE